MMQYPHDHVAHCIRCKDPFHYDASLSIIAPRVCDQCKISRQIRTEGARMEQRKKAHKAQGERRKQQARTLGYESDAMGKNLTALTIRTHSEVAAILGITPESSRLAERSALAKLRKAFASHMLERNIDNSLRAGQ